MWTAVVCVFVAVCLPAFPAAGAEGDVSVADLPMGAAPDAVPPEYFPDRAHAVVWRNWTVVPTERIAAVVGATPADVLAIGKSMGLAAPPAISEDQLERSYITVIRRNWHLLPYDQLNALLGWTAEKMEYTLREGDGLFWWFGGYKPQVEPVRYTPPDAAAQARAAEIAAAMRSAFPEGVDTIVEPPFAFVEELTDMSGVVPRETPPSSGDTFSPRYCFSYFGSFRHPLSDIDAIYPEGYLARLAELGITGVWLHEPLYHLAAYPWEPARSEGYEENLANLARLVARARKYGIGIYIYLNEPRPMPMAFFEKHPELKGVDDVSVLPGQVATICVSVPEVQQYLRDAVASVCTAVPDLAGFFTITASESYTNCWSHGRGDTCPRCSKRPPEEVIASVNTLITEGIAQAGAKTTLFAWDWGWRDDLVEGIIARLPESASLISVSEWSTPISRGGVDSAVGEYSLSVVGPGPRATAHWKLAQDRGLGTVAKIQASTTWELGSVPYIPVVATAAQHAANLRDAGVNGLMMSWTLGCYPSPSFEAVMEMARPEKPSVDDALQAVAQRRFGDAAAPAVVEAWKDFSAALNEYPFNIGVLYHSPVHMGPANPLYATPTGYADGTIMGFGFPLDGLNRWRGIYPSDTFARQFERVAQGFNDALDRLRSRVNIDATPGLDEEMRVAEACAIHFQSVANQTRFVLLRDTLAANPPADDALATLDALEAIVRQERALAIRLHAIQQRDSRIGFEAACHYFFVNVDLGEKVVNCDDLLTRWIPEERKKLE